MPLNDQDKLQREYQSKLSCDSVEMLKIRLVPGMEMLAQEMGGEVQQYLPDLVDPTEFSDEQLHSPAAPWRPYEYEENPIELEYPPSPLPDESPAFGCYGDPFASPFVDTEDYRSHHLGEPGPIGEPCPREFPWRSPGEYPYPWNQPLWSDIVAQGLEPDWEHNEVWYSPYGPDNLPETPDFLPCDASPQPEWWDMYFPGRSPASSPNSDSWNEPFVSPSPWCPDSYLMDPRLRTQTRRRSQRWMHDATASFPVVFIEADKVAFFENQSDLAQFTADRSEDGKQKIGLNLAHVVSVEKITAYSAYAQNVQVEDVAVGVDWKEPPLEPVPFSIELPEVIPLLRKPEDMMMFQVVAKGGQGPYKFYMRGMPYDLYITTDGWVRGFIEESQWPTEDFRDYNWQIIVEDSSTPQNTAVVNLRYRIYPVPPKGPGPALPPVPEEDPDAPPTC